MSGADPLARLKRLSAKKHTTTLVALGSLRMPDVPRTKVPANLNPEGREVFIRVPGSAYRIGESVAYPLSEDGALYGVFRPITAEATASLLSRAMDPPEGWFGAIAMPPCDGFSRGHLEVVTRDLVPTDGVLRLSSQMPDCPATHTAASKPMPKRFCRWFAQPPGGGPDLMVGTVEVWVDRFGRWWPTGYSVKPDWVARYPDRGVMLDKTLGLSTAA